MVVDTSAALAVLHEEPGWERYVARLEEAETAVIAAPTLVEAGMVVEARRGAGGRRLLEGLMRLYQVRVVAFDVEHALLALEGFRPFGKGRHPAGLNLGDCFAYALARQREEPLLFKGDDFARTDVEPALIP